MISIPVMNYHGGKFRLAPWIISHFPEHHIYVEPFGGAAGVMLQKKPVAHEVYNDLDREIVNVFRVLRSPVKSKALKALLTLTPYAREELAIAYKPTRISVEQARRTLIRAWFGYGSAGATKNSSGFCTHTSLKSNSHNRPARFNRMKEQIEAFTERLQSVTIENKDATAVMLQHDSPQTLFYIDPPYPMETRAQRQGYRFEMTLEDHQRLLECVLQLRGMVIVGSYMNSTYAEMLRGWECVSRSVSASGQSGGVKRTECLWIKPNTNRQLHFDFCLNAETVGA